MGNGNYGCLLPWPPRRWKQHLQYVDYIKVGPYGICSPVSERFWIPAFHGPPRVTSFTGPQGPVPRPGTGGIDDILYEGELENGNELGLCDVTIQGTYPFRRWRRVWTHLFRITGTIEITPPQPPMFDPPQLTMGKGQQESVDITVAPACKYDIVITVADEIPNGIQALPTLVTTDRATGKATVSVRDLANKERGLSLVATIKSERPCEKQEITATLPVSIA